MPKKQPPLEPGYDPGQVDRFKARPEFRYVEWDGSRWPFFVSGFGIYRAEEQSGLDLYGMLFGIALKGARAAAMVQSDEGTAEEKIERAALAMQTMGFGDNLRTYAAVMFSGVAVFYPEMRYEDILMRITTRNMAAIEPLVVDEIQKIQRDRKATVNGQVEAEQEAGN